MSTTAIPGAPDDVVRVFVSYAREDRRWLDRDYRYSLIPFLMDSLRRHNVAFWFDKELKPGDEFRRYIESEIDQSQIALLIVSQSFLNSEFIENREMPRIAERARQGKMIVVPVLVEPCDWSEYPFLADRQMVPSSPLIDYTESEPQWAKVRFQILDGLKAQAKRIREAPQAPVSPAAEQEAAERETAAQAALRAEKEAEQIRLQQEREAEELRKRDAEREATAQAALLAEKETEQIKQQEREAEELRRREAEREAAAQAALRAEQQAEQIRQQREREAEELRRQQAEQEAAAQAALRAEKETEQIRQQQEREAEERRNREKEAEQPRQHQERNFPTSQPVLQLGSEPDVSRVLSSEPQRAKVQFRILDVLKAQLKRIRDTLESQIQKVRAGLAEATGTRSKTRAWEVISLGRTRKLFLIGVLMLSFSLVAGNLSWFAAILGIGWFGNYSMLSPFGNKIDSLISGSLGPGFDGFVVSCFAYAGPGLFIAGLALGLGRWTRFWGAALAVFLLLSLALCSGRILATDIMLGYRGLSFSPVDWNQAWVQMEGEFFKLAVVGALLIAVGVELQQHDIAGWRRAASRWTGAGKYIFGANLLLYLASRAWSSAMFIQDYPFDYGYWRYYFLWALWWGTRTAFVLSPAIIVACVCIFFPRWTRIAAICFSAASIAFIPMLFLDWWGQVPGDQSVGMFVIWAGDVGLAGGALLWSASQRPKTFEVSEPAGAPTLHPLPAPVDKPKAAEVPIAETAPQPFAPKVAGPKDWSEIYGGEHEKARIPRKWMIAFAGAAVLVVALLSFMVSMNRGNTWNARNSGTTQDLHSIFGTSDGKHLWTVGNLGTILESEDGGASWSARDSGTTQGLVSIFGTSDGNRLWAVGWLGTILESDDGGTSWAARKSGKSAALFSIFGTSGGKQLWAVGDKGTIVESVDGGASWMARNSRSRQWLHSIFGTSDGGRLWAVGQNGTVLESDDGGANWAASNIGTEYDLYSVFATSDDKRLWAVGELGVCAKSDDGGASWVGDGTGWEAGVGAIFGTGNGKYLWAVGDEGTIVESTDGGARWAERNSGTTVYLQSIFGTSDGEHLWAVGDRGTILEWGH